MASAELAVNQRQADAAAGRGASRTNAGDALAQRLDCRIEALLLAGDEPLSIDQLLRLLDAGSSGLERATIRAALASLGERLRVGASELVEVAGGWRLQVRAQFSPDIARLWEERPSKLSRAMLETLALIIYRQPVTRGEIEQVRGVAVSTSTMNTLLARDWVKVLGHKEVPGRPALYGTTTRLLDDLGLKTLDQLPELPQVQDLAQLDAALAARLGVVGVAPSVPSPAAAADAPRAEQRTSGVDPTVGP
ncbi:MAG TPA: SMC-Scp complex subunit ScpB [Nevskiaceae bacterium]